MGFSRYAILIARDSVSASKRPTLVRFREEAWRVLLLGVYHEPELRLDLRRLDRVGAANYIATPASFPIASLCSSLSINAVFLFVG